MSLENLSLALAWNLHWRQCTLGLFLTQHSPGPIHLTTQFPPFWNEIGRKKIKEIFLKVKSRANVSCLCPYSFLLDPTLSLLAFQRPPAGGLSMPSLSVPTIWGLKEKVNTNPLYSSHQRSLHLGILPKKVFVVLTRPWFIWGILLLGMGKSSLELPEKLKCLTHSQHWACQTEGSITSVTELWTRDRSPSSWVGLALAKKDFLCRCLWY